MTSKTLFDSTLILRVTLFIILITHSIPGMFNGGVQSFGQDYLNAIGFAPLGVPLAWAIKLSHVVCAVALLLRRYVRVAAIITIAILVMGIIFVHYPEGWFVVGGGRNGMEYNVLLISVLVYLMLIERK
ncbi:DoxX family protein [Parachryseolinea silvisoli]|uniref:DoxX family protein n=1 Tax=Parachryseolinea silvisoli TaxID=2873601 RepID=UPI0022658FCA|nr:DoxX family protein [Parachryseolinea silvisoli]MCD9015591.1 DoxX family protein [Parachryseolinea silvisoli]